MLKIIILIFLLSILTTISLSSITNDKRERAKIYNLQNKNQEWSSFKVRHGKSYRNKSHETQR